MFGAERRFLSPVSCLSTPLRYYFQIGSVDGFERKLEDAQMELGIPSADQVSVKFMQEGSIVNAMFELLPTLLLIGATYWCGGRGHV